MDLTGLFPDCISSHVLMRTVEGVVIWREVNLYATILLCDQWQWWQSHYLLKQVYEKFHFIEILTNQLELFL